MNPETKKLLLQYDEDQAWEIPSSFDAPAIEQRARRVYLELCQTFGPLAFEDWIHNQDASFGLAIVFKPYEVRHAVAVLQPAIRFSNFGNLATFTFEEQLPKDARKTIVDTLLRHGFRYVDAEELDEPYDGIMSPNETIHTWWTRYFDWL